MKYKLFCRVAFVLCAMALTACHSHTSYNTSEDHSNSSHTDKDTHEGHDESEIIFTPAQAKAAGVAIETLAPSDFSQVVRVSGNVLPSLGSETTISATMSGIVHLANPKTTEGTPVRSNQTIFNISTQVLGNGNPVAAAKAELEAAENEWERAKMLIVDKIISQREYENARLRYETAKSTSESLGNGKGQRAIKTPTGGYLQTLLVGNGEYVTAGQPLALITEDRHLQLRAEIPERYYSFINDIVSANFRLSSHSDKVYELKKMDGRLLSKGRTTNKGEGFLPVIFEFNNVDNIITGSLAEIFLLGKNQPNTLSVPTSALTEELGLYYVYVQTSDHSYRKQLVEIGANNGKRTAITSGLHNGDKVVSRGAIAVKLAANAGMMPDVHAGHNH